MEILSLVLRFELLSGKIDQIVIYDQGGSNYNYPGQRWNPKLVWNKNTRFKKDKIWTKNINFPSFEFVSC